MRSFVEAPRNSWSRFERFFGADIRRRVAQRFPRDVSTGQRDDAYQPRRDAVRIDGPMPLSTRRRNIASA